MKILRWIKEFIIEILTKLMLICCIPVIWFMEFSRWIHEKIWGSD